MNQKTKHATLWYTKTEYETTPVEEKLQTPLSKPLLGGIKVIRGNIEPIKDIDEVVLPDQEMFQQLKSLGYIEEK